MDDPVIEIGRILYDIEILILLNEKKEVKL
jgi:hypothetical protein